MAGIARPSSRAVKPRQFDWPLFLTSLALLALGLLSLYSVGLRDHGPYFKKQIAMAVVGLAPFALFYFVRPDFWKRIATPLYLFNLLILGAVLIVGVTNNGAQRWIDLKFVQFQPSELAKLLTILTLASFFVARAEKLNRLSTFALSFLHVAVPALLIARQPHYGGALVLIVVWLSISIATGVPVKFIVAAVALLLVGVVVAVKTPGAIHDYHLKRIRAMRVEDKAGASYQQDRAQVALGAGGLFGTGLFHGKQSLPEQQNDFIFTVLGEELGLVGSTVIIAAFGFFFYRLWLVMFHAKEPYYRMLAAGVLGLLAFHAAVNIAMVLQLFPVVGLWLPFMSAGGTALWLCMACMGLMLNGRGRAKQSLF